MHCSYNEKLASPLRWGLVLLGACLAAGTATAQTAATPPVREIRAMRYPGISPDGKQIVFSYRGDLWLVGSEGGVATRVADLPGWDMRARFSPDGKTLAFCSDRNGHLDIYTIPVTGGEAVRVTYHTSEDLLGDWTPDGKGLVFYSSRDSRAASVYHIQLADGRLRQLSFDEQVLQNPVVSPDGSRVAYSRGRAEWARKGYRGSANGDVYVGSIQNPKTPPIQLTNSPGHEIWPMFSADGKSLYYVTDTDGVGNLWRVSPTGGRKTQVTRQRDGYVHYPCISRDGSRIVYETDFSLWVVDPRGKSPRPERLKVLAAVPDKPEMVERKLDQRAQEVEVSPDGKSLLLVVRGDLLLIPESGGTARRLTDSLAMDFDTVWAPDGKSVVYVSEREANVDLYVCDVASGVSRRLTSHPDPDTSPQYSADGKEILFIRGPNGRQIVSVPAAGGSERVLVEGAFLSDARWSPDGKWVAYARRTHAAITNIYVSPTSGGSEINVTRWTGVNSDPVWSSDGRYLAFLSTRSGSSDSYMVNLDGKSPAERTSGSASPDATRPAVPEVAIDPQGIERRVRALASEPTGSKFNPIFLPDGKSILYSASGSIYSVPVDGGRPTKVLDGFGGLVRTSPDGATLYALQPQGALRKAPRTGGQPTAITYTASFQYELMEDRRQTFDQAWRMLRDYFYDPKMHGADWAAVRSRYRAVVDECVDLNDFHLLLAEMTGELNASHLGVTRTNTTRPTNPTASLGVWIDWEHAGPGLKVSGVLRGGPADDSASRIRPGEFILAVGTRDVTPTERLFEILAGLSGRRTELTVNDRPSKEGARKVSLTPTSSADFANAYYEHWVQSNRDRVRQLSGGKLSYLHIRAMDQPSLQRFERELLTEAYDSEGMVLDIRFNGGGRIHDDLLAILGKRVHAYETPRSALKMTQPFGAFVRPSVLVINEGCFSDAEIFPNGYRANGHGPLIGISTAGGVIGTNNRPLLDGLTTFRIPTTGWQDLNGKNLENTGVEPDIEVPMGPADLLAGRDPQLERGVAELMKRLKAARRK